MKAEGRPRRILPLDPFSVADSVGAAQARSGIRAVFPTEQDSLQKKGLVEGFGLGVPVAS